MKLVNNTLLAFAAEGVADALALALQLGIGVAGVRDTFGGRPLASPWMAGKLPRLEDSDVSPEFSLALKEFHLALEQVGAKPFPVLTAMAHE